MAIDGGEERNRLQNSEIDRRLIGRGRKNAAGRSASVTVTRTNVERGAVASDFSKKGSGKSAGDRLFCSRSCRARGVGPFTVVALDARPESQTMRRADSALFTRGIR